MKIGFCHESAENAIITADGCTLQNESLATLLARLEGILGPIPDSMLQEGCYTHRYFTVSGALYEQNEKSVSPDPVSAIFLHQSDMLPS